MTDQVLRVTHVVCSDSYAGVESSIVTLSREQSANGHRVRVLGGEPDRMSNELAGSNVAWSPCRTPREAVTRLLNRRERPQLIHAHMTQAEVAATAAAAIHGWPVVATRHFAGQRGSSGPSRVVASIAARRIAEQIAISEFVARTVEGRSTVVYPGVCSTEVVLGPGSRRPVILVSSRMEAEKDVDVAIRAWAASALGTRGWTMEIAGHGSHKPALERLAAAQTPPGTVRFLGRRADMAALYASSAILLAPAHAEPLGLSVLEAMSSGLPVVAADGGAHPETVGSASTAALFPPGDAQAAGSLLATLAADPAARTAYGAELARVQQDRFTVHVQYRETQKVYLRALGGIA